MADCTCRYRHFEDRRQGQRRDASLGVTRMIFTGEEQRSCERRRVKRAKGQSYFDYSAGD